MIPKSEQGIKQWLDELKKHPLTAKMREDLAAKELAKRKDAARKIAALEKERDETVPKLRAILDEKERKLKEAQTALNTAASEFNTAKYNLSAENHNFETSIANYATILVESADPALNIAMAFFQDKLTWLRSPGRISRNAAGSEVNIFSESKKTREESNAPAVKSALAYCQEAIKELESMKLLPIPDLQRIEGLKTAIPDISVYTLFEGEKPLSR